MPLSLNIIGAGHLGKTLGKLLVQTQPVSLDYICNRSLASTKAAINFIGMGQACEEIAQLPPADLNFITTQDDVIAAVAWQLSEANLKKGSVVLHCSGSLTSDILAATKTKGCHIASVHPMASFAKPQLSVTQYAGTYCAMEGDASAIMILEPLFTAIGSITHIINKNKKALYHAAGVFASNYLVTLAEQASTCLYKADVAHPIAMPLICKVMQDTIANLKETLSPALSLTGPLKRGDCATVANQMRSFTDPMQQELYSTLGKATLVLTDHEQVLKEQLENILKISQERDA